MRQMEMNRKNNRGEQQGERRGKAKGKSVQFFWKQAVGSRKELDLSTAVDEDVFIWAPGPQRGVRAERS